MGLRKSGSSFLLEKRKPPAPKAPPPVIQKVVQNNIVSPKIVIVDFGGTGINTAQLAPYAAAQLRQVNEQFALPPPLGYGMGVKQIRVGKPSDIQPDEWVLGLYEHPDMAGALGYHDVTASGKPVMKVFPKLDMNDGADWRVTCSHEVLETLQDPEICLCAQAPDGKFWAYEICDFVECDIYSIDGVPLSNWNTPAAFEPPQNLTGIKFDWMGLSKHPHENRPGGYGQYWTDGGWQQVFGMKARAFRRGLAKEHGRGFQRRAKSASSVAARKHHAEISEEDVTTRVSVPVVASVVVPPALVVPSPPPVVIEEMPIVETIEVAEVKRAKRRSRKSSSALPFHTKHLF